MAYADSSEEIEKLARRSRKAWETAHLRHTALREAYRWYMPMRYRAMESGGVEGNNTRSIYDHLYDATGLQAHEDGASQIAEAIHPWDQVWARWVPRTDINEDVRNQAEELAEKITEVCTALVNRSQFDGAAVAAHKEFLLGTGFLAIDQDPSDPARVRFTALPAWQMAIEADASGRIQGVFRKMKIRTRDLDAAVPGGDWSAQAKEQRDNTPDHEIEVEMAVYWSPEERAWRVCYYECATKHKVAEQVEKTPPIIVYRANIEAGHAWGDGPGMKALPDVKTANRVVEFILRHASIAIGGIWQADDDGVLNPNNVRLVPGAIISKAVGSAGLTPVTTGMDFDVSQIVLEDLRVQIRRAFYVTRIEEREMSATEYSGRLQQQLREQRGVYGQLKSEFAEQVMLRVLDLAVRMGLILTQDFDRLAQLELTGPLASDVRGVAVDRFKATVRDVQEIIGPELAVAAIAVEKAVPWLAQQRHADLELFRDEGQMQALGQQIQDMAVELAAQAQVEQAAAQAGVA